MISKSLVLAALVTLAASFSALAHEQKYSAVLDGPTEPTASPGLGTALVVIDTDTFMMHVEASFSGLEGETTAAHIHASTTVPFTGQAGVATVVPTFTGFPLGVTAGNYAHDFDMSLAASYNAAFVTANGGTAASAFAALLAGLDNGKAYFNVHSKKYNAGEIRGFFKPVPEPSTWCLGLAGLTGLAFVRLRRRATDR